MNYPKMISDQMPTIMKIIKRTEGNIARATGIKLSIQIGEILEVEDTEVQILDHIIKCLSVWGISYSDLIKKDKKTEAVTRRMITALLLDTYYTGFFSQKTMATKIGLKDHSSFQNMVKRAKGLRDVEDNIFQKYYLPVKHLFDENKNK